MSELPPNQCSIPSADGDLGRRQPAAHEASGAQTFGGTSRRKRNVACKILLKSQHRLLWLWPQYFPKHDVVTGRLKTVSRFVFVALCVFRQPGGTLWQQRRPSHPRSTRRSGWR
jgi:hypothetical protein